jgi:hypothetical protein
MKPIDTLRANNDLPKVEAYEEAKLGTRFATLPPDPMAVMSILIKADAALDELAGRLVEAEEEIERLRHEGTPGVMHEVDRAFYDLTVAQRDQAWAEVQRLRRENAMLRCGQRPPVVKTYLSALSTTIAQAKGEKG